MDRTMGKLVILVLLLIISGISALYVRIKSSRVQKALDSDINDIKISGQKIMVNLEECKVLSSEHIELQHRNRYNDAGWAVTGAGYDVHGNEKVVNDCVLTYDWQDPQYPFEKKTFISSNINKDKDTIAFYLSYHKQTVIYYDSAKDSYYFDLSFLQQ